MDHSWPLTGDVVDPRREFIQGNAPGAGQTISVWMFWIKAIIRGVKAIRQFAESKYRGFSYKIYGPAVRCKRAVSGWMRDGSHQSIRPPCGALAPGHHGNPRAPGLLKTKASASHFYSQASGAPGNRSSILSHPSREPRRELDRQKHWRSEQAQTVRRVNSGS
jgi:hypothetical protein